MIGITGYKYHNQVHRQKRELFLFPNDWDWFVRILKTTLYCKHPHLWYDSGHNLYPGKPLSLLTGVFNKEKRLSKTVLKTELALNDVVPDI